MKKMLVSDYDGTFYRSEEEILKNIELTKKFQQRGNLFILATGRSYESFIHEIDKFNMVFDYLILCSGALILNKELKVLKAHFMNKKIVKAMLLEAKDIKEEIIESIFVGLYDRSDTLDGVDELTKLIIVMKDDEKARVLANLYNYKYKEEMITYIVPTSNHKRIYVEVISRNTNKAQGIRDLKEMIGLRDLEVITIGDSENDREMVIDFNGYAISNAHEDLLKHKPRRIDSIESLIKDLNL